MVFLVFQTNGDTNNNINNRKTNVDLELDSNPWGERFSIKNVRIYETIK